MTSWVKVLGNGPIGRQKSLGMPWGFESLHPAFPLPNRLVEFSARLFRYQSCRCSTLDSTSRFAA
jgi:hypothetical protein